MQHWILALAAALTCAAAARADQPAILAGIREYFAEPDAGRRAALATRIAADPDFNRHELGDWLHAAELFPPQPPGRQTFEVTLADGRRRSVVARLPERYEPKGCWPMIYALHGQGSNADQIIRYVEQALGQRADSCIIVAPDQYEEMMLHHAHWPPLEEHARVRAEARRRFHVDHDRVYAMGYSMGGHTAWNEATMHPDEFAGVLALAGTLLVPENERLWPHLLPNLTALPVTCVWGAKDSLGPGGSASDVGGIAGLNRRLKQLAAEAQLGHLTFVELPDADHFNVLPPADALDELLVQHRVRFPARVRHVFRHAGQARAYWLSGADWAGEQWTDKPPRVTIHETVNDLATAEEISESFAAAYRGWMGELRGEVEGQTVRVARKRLKEITIRFGLTQIDWDRPIELRVNGRLVFEGQLQPDAGVALEHARLNYDFDRLYWAAIRYRTGRKAEVLTAAGF